jgi:DNA-binding NarL/FixJ family response regulator
MGCWRRSTRASRSGRSPDGAGDLARDAGLTDGESQLERSAVRNGQVAVVLAGFGPVINRGLVQILSDELTLRVLADAVDLGELEAVVAQHAPRVAVLDESQVLDPAILRRLTASDPRLGIVILAHRPSRRYVMRLLSFGATSCLSKEAPAEDLLLAIRLAADGKQLLSCSALADSQAGDERTSLTPREQQVLDLLRLGYSNAEIALALSIGAETVHTHIAHIYRKLGVSNRRELQEGELLL